MDQSIRRRIANDDLTYDEAADLEETEVETPEALLVSGVLVPTPNWLRRVLSKSESNGRGQDISPKVFNERRRHPRIVNPNSVGHAGSERK